jgi:glycosyltransferase involved in cell wall biosynthesis
MTGRRPLLIVRGDLRSETGWSRATRALIDAVADDFVLVVGVDVHFHPARSRSDFPHAVVDEAAAAKMSSEVPGAVVLHAVLPGGILRHAGSVNLGWWFWETDKLPVASDWALKLAALDAMLSPSLWQAAIVRHLLPQLAIRIVRWPHLGLVEPRHVPAPACQALTLYRPFARDELRRLQLAPGARRDGDPGAALLAAATLPPDILLSCRDGYFLAVQSDAPRKGLPVLLSEWCRYRADSSRSTGLLVRFSSLDVGLGPTEKLRRFSEIAHDAARGDDAKLENVFVLLDEVPRPTLDILYGAATAYVSPSFGEGFGGTLVEAAAEGCPVVAPRHTACGELLPPSYRFAFDTIAHIGGLMDQLPIQPPNGSWHVPRPGAIAAMLRELETLDAVERARHAADLRQHLASLLAPELARQEVAAALLEADAARGRA